MYLTGYDARVSASHIPCDLGAVVDKTKGEYKKEIEESWRQTMTRLTANAENPKYWELEHFGADYDIRYIEGDVTVAVVELLIFISFATPIANESTTQLEEVLRTLLAETGITLKNMELHRTN